MANKNFEFEYNCDVVVERIKTNRANHAETYSEAWQGYLIELREKLDDAVKEVRKSIRILEAGEVPPRDIPLSFNAYVVPPIDHTDEYDRVIDMLEATVEDLITLTPQEFNQYMRDEWAWSQEFTTSTTNFISKANTGKFG